LKIITSIILLHLIFFTNSNYFLSIQAKNPCLKFHNTLLFCSSEYQLQQEVQNNKEKEARLFYEKGLDLHNIAEFILAETAFLEVIKLSENTNHDEIRAFSFHYLGNIASWKSNFPQSILYHKKARILFYKLNNLEYVAISNNYISTGFEALGEYDSTIVYFKKNIKNHVAGNFENTTLTKKRGLADYFKKKNENQVVGNFENTILNSYRGLAALYAKLYNYKQAYSYLQQGIQYAEETGNNKSLAKLYFTAGQLFLNNHVNIDIALEYLLEAKSLFTEADNSNYLKWVNISIGDVHNKTGNDSLAMHFYKEVSSRLHPDNYSTNSIVDHKIGMVYKERKEYDSALYYLQKSIDGMCTVCPEIQIHNTLIQAGRTYLIRGNSQQAFIYLSRARNIAKESKSGLEMVISSEELAKYYQSIQKQDSVIYFLNDAYNLAKELGLLQRIKTTAESLSKIYYSSGISVF